MARSPFTHLCLVLWLLTAVMLVMTAWSVVSLAKEMDDFGLEEADPELPAKIKKWNADCLSCHSQQGVEKPPRQGMDLKKLANLIVDQGRFEHSDHGKTACKDCHTEAYVKYPHEEKARPKIKTCVECHQNPAKTIVPEFKASAHFKGHSEKFTCLSCHNSHEGRKASRLETAREAALQDNRMCQNCHDDDARFAKLKSDGKRPDMGKVHDWLPELALHLSQTRCVDCHSPAADAGALSHEVQKKDKALRQCESCHAPDTELGRRLYKRKLLDKPGEAGGFSNAALLQEIYVVGATRNAWLDWAALAALVATMAAVALAKFLKRRK